MARRRLSPEEQAAWQQLARSVNPLAGARAATQVGADIAATDRQDPLEDSKTPKALTRSSSPSIHPSVVQPSPVAVLDSSWARRISSEEHTSELQSLMRNSYAVFCITKQNQ